MDDQVQRLIQAGVWPAEEADDLIKKQREQFLPGGLNTPDHFFYKILLQDPEMEVGDLWYTVVELAGTRQFFVMDVQVHDAFRRHGYGSEAFRLLEDEARIMGIKVISLDVVEENRPARKMYEKLGYIGREDRLSKKLEP